MDGDKSVRARTAVRMITLIRGVFIFDLVLGLGCYAWEKWADCRARSDSLRPTPIMIPSRERVEKMFALCDGDRHQSDPGFGRDRSRNFWFVRCPTSGEAGP